MKDDTKVGIVVCILLVFVSFGIWKFTELLVGSTPSGGSSSIVIACIWSSLILMIFSGLGWFVYLVQTDGFNRRKVINQYKTQAVRDRMDHKLIEAKKEHH